MIEARAPTTNGAWVTSRAPCRRCPCGSLTRASWMCGPKDSQRSKTLQRAVARIGNLEQRVELRELEERLEIVVQVREAQLPALLTDLLRQRHQHAESRAV